MFNALGRKNAEYMLSFQESVLLNKHYHVAGFTLLEIMLAMLILGIVVSMVSFSLSGSIRAVEGTMEQGEIYYRAQVALDRITEDLASAVLPAGIEFVGGESDGGGGELSFASFAHIVFDPDTDHPGMAVIGYSVKADKDDPRQLFLLRSDVLYRPSEDATPRETGEGAAGFLLCDRLRSVKFSFLDQNGDEVETWNTRVEDGDDAGKRRLPAAVTCSLEFWLNPEDDTSITFETTVVLPVGMIQAESEMEKGNAS